MKPDHKAMIIAAANAGAEQNFTIWKAKAIEEIEKMPSIIQLGLDGKTEIEYINRNELLTKLRKL
jgi:hypothetical protein